MDAADEVYDLISIDEFHEHDFDLTHDIHVRISGYVQGNFGGEVFKVWVKGIADGADLSDAKVSSDGNVTFAGLPTVAQAGVFQTEWLALDVKDKLTGDAFIAVALELDSINDASADEVAPLVLAFRGTRSICSSTGARVRT